MPDLSLVMLGAGNSTRFKYPVKKQWLRFGDTPLWLFSTKNIASRLNLSKIVVTCSADEIEYMKRFDDSITYVLGGASRQESLRNALAHIDTPYVLVSDIARVCIDGDMLLRVVEKKSQSDTVVPYLEVSDTVVYGDETIDRDRVKLIQTPQLSKTSLLKKALTTETDYTDDRGAIEANGGKVLYVKGDKRAKKLTFLDDLNEIVCKKEPSKSLFVGSGFDVHGFEDGKVMMLGGVEIQSSFGFKAHSDGDVVIHALIDSLLGAIGAGDIGELFPDSDDRFKGIDSKELLKKVYRFVTSVGYEVVNSDITIIAQTPKLKEYKQKMSSVLAAILQIKPVFINIKATTTENLGFIGRKEGVAVNATSTLKYCDWTKI